MKLVVTAATLLLWIFGANAAFGAAPDPLPRALLEHCVGCDAHGMDLHGRDLHGIRLIGANLSGADLRGANLRGASLTGCNLRNAKLDGADLTDARMVGVSLEGASFTGAKLQGLKLTGVNFRGAPLASAGRHVFLRSCTGCDMRGAMLQDMDFPHVFKIGSNLRDAHLTGSEAQRVTPSGASQHNAIICYPKEAWDGKRKISTDEMRCVNLHGASLRGRVRVFVRPEARTAPEANASASASPEIRVRAPEAEASARVVQTENMTSDDSDCRPVKVEELRQHSHADLDGARLE